MKKSKQGKLEFPTTPDLDILALLKEPKNKKVFYKAYYKNYAEENIVQIALSGDEDEVILYNTPLYFFMGLENLPTLEVLKENPCYWANLYKIAKAAYTVLARVNKGIPEYEWTLRTRKEFDKIVERYKDKLTTYLIKKVKANGGYFPTLSPTKTIEELLLRGWVHEDDAKLNRDKYNLRCHVAPLTWPESFDQHQDACQASEKYGIGGRTGTILPKSKK